MKLDIIVVGSDEDGEETVEASKSIEAVPTSFESIALV